MIVATAALTAPAPARSAAVQTRSPMPDLPVLDLVHPLPGFADLRRFALVQLDDDGVLCSLRSLEDPEIRFLVVPPFAFFPDYAPVVGDDVVDDLGIESVDDVLVLVVVNAGGSVESTTANLLAPVVVNTVNRRAAQVLLDDAALSVAVPLGA